MTSLINGITLKAVNSKEGVKQLQNENVNFTKQIDTRQTSHGNEGKLYLNAADRRNRVTRQLFVDESSKNTFETTEKNYQANKNNETKQLKNKIPEPGQWKKRGIGRPCVVCDEILEAGKVMEKHMSAKHSEELKSIPVSNDMAESVRTKCVLCEKIFVIPRMRAHVKAAHGITVVDYRRDYLAGNIELALKISFDNLTNISIYQHNC